MPQVKMFAFWEPAEIRAAIVSLEQKLASGAQSVSDPNGGSATFLTASQVRYQLSELYARYEEKTGVSLRERDVTVIVNTSVRRFD